MFIPDDIDVQYTVIKGSEIPMHSLLLSILPGGYPAYNTPSQADPIVYSLNLEAIRYKIFDRLPALHLEVHRLH